ncbi:GNAT family N-acetyltransferase [Pseudactinotalea suaedae]|jgi:GNAT superfamily N-acetyltransferase|uniref:GNAT family N-acetyltransferase n=1 Tax=Pseudactinotalea suaedae TaxID=1524924 RepID=UPI0012E31498|nr:GNAT family N-acetyltransferase [Pseudactinotalea suaedae]
MPQTPVPRILAPRADQAAELTELALRSKGHWGYDAAFLAACRAELTYTAADCRSGDMAVAYVGEELAGLVRLTGAAPEGELQSLFVDPPWIGTGVGAALLGHALDEARRRGMSRVVLDADPGAEPFYARFGARRTGEVPSGSIPGRMLPRMELTLSSV